MGQDAMEINNMLMEVARPFVARLMVMGVLPNRDFKTLSPCDLLNARDRFRQAPPLDLPPLKYGEVEGYLGVLITFNHILKLLSSHGIRPAYEMLEDKLRQGAFARFMCRNEGLGKAKHLMQHSLSQGAPSPKLLKMLEVLIDHFKAKDPQNSRVIIFSNFRGSVRDIMNALSGIGEYVKAMQFIGQSSGKTLKGQSQKVQQAVLQKFRDGGYNVIVATSIGEEGLDIMEVDLVICFDANISPLRMIQRMGRTGRKNKGRVIVLACKGTELNGYKRKQANNNTINKHLRNGGSNSFNFHASPRMIPHIFKPEVKLVELSIKQFVPRGRKVKDDYRSETPAYKTKLTDAESDLIAKYFEPLNRNDAWRPSLIAFPHYQAFPSRVHRVMHSIRTRMLIDVMQSFQGLTFVKESKASIREDEQVSRLSLGVKAALQQENSITDSWISHKSLEECKKAADFNPLDTENSHCHCQHSPTHCCLFGSDFVSVDSAGRVMVSSVPLLPLKEISQTTSLKQDSLSPKFQLRDYVATSKAKDVFDLTTASPGRSTRIENDMGLLLVDEYKSDDFKDVELSPRLSNFIQSGIVPESPICCDGTPSKGRRNSMGADPGLSNQPNIEASLKSFPVPSQKYNESESKIDLPASPKLSPIPFQKHDEPESKIHLPASFVNEEIQTPVLENNIKHRAARANVVVSQLIEQVQAPVPAVLEDSSSNCCSREWCLSSSDKSASFQRERKLKRLRKYGDQQRVRPLEGERNTISPKLNKTRAHENGIGKRKRQKDGVRAYIEEEAEVSSEVEVSDDEEEVHEMNNSYEEGFIDDRINPTIGITQAETSACDMMAIYRRSLLSQSPMGRLSNGSTEHSSDSVAPYSRSDSMTPSGMMTYQSLCKSPDVLETEENEKISSELVPCRESGIHKGSRNGFGKRKRKLNSYQVPAVNLEKQFSCQSGTVARVVTPCDQVGQERRTEANAAAFNGGDDDEFYEGLDLDAVEEEAAKLLEQKSGPSVLNGIVVSKPDTQQLGLKGSPSFDLGI